jgi:hypothetical protein
VRRAAKKKAPPLEDGDDQLPTRIAEYLRIEQQRV